jgi:hypothetical protein
MSSRKKLYCSLWEKTASDNISKTMQLLKRITASLTYKHPTLPTQHGCLASESGIKLTNNAGIALAFFNNQHWFK